MAMSKAKNVMSDTDREMSIPHLLFDANVFIMQNMSIGDYDSAYTQVEFLENIIEPFRDKIYNQEIDKLMATPKPSGNTAMKRKRITDAYTKEIMFGKHKAIMKLAFRQGWLGATRKGSEMKTGILE